MKTHIILLFLFFIALFSCNKKPLPSNTIDTPVFYFQGEINNTAKLIEAGNDSAYMFTNTFTNAASEKTLQGWFANQSNANSEPNLLFELINYKPNGTGNIATEIFNIQNFYSLSLDTISTIDTTEEFTFIPSDTTNVVATYLWKFDDGTSSTAMKPKKTFATQGQHNVTLYYNAGAGCGVDSISNYINTNLNSACRAQFSISNTSVLDSIKVQATTTLGAGKSLTWYWGNGDSTNTFVDSSGHIYSDSFSHTIVLVASNNNCNVSYVAKKNAIGPNKCSASFNYTSQIQTTITTGNVRKNSFVITWKNAGNTYKSYKTNTNANQSNKLILKANSTNLYNTNTVSINGNTNCWLYNVTNNNDSIQIISTKLNFALGF